MLSDRTIKNLKPTTEHQFISDGHGLYLRVHPSGKKQFLLRSRLGGKASWTPLGDYPSLSLLDARNLAINKTLRKDSTTVDELFESFYKHISTYYKNPDIVRARYIANVKSTLGDRPVTSVTRAEVADLLQTIIDRNAPIMANRILSFIKLMFNFAVSRGLLEYNTLQLLTKKHVGGKETPRSKTLTDDELFEMFKLIKHSGMDVKTKAGILLVLITGQRSSEVLGINKSEISGVWWLIPKERTKTDKAHKVYLSVQARAIIKLLMNLFGDSPLNIDHRTLAKALKRKNTDYTPHDLRRTLATRLSDLGVMPHVIEKMLNHQMEGVMAVYNRAEYLPERKEAWQLWGRHLAAIRRRKD